MKDETIKAIEKYFCQCDSVINYYGEFENIEIATNAFLSGERLFGDAPDMIVKHNDVILVCEHFEFDCYLNNRKGSQHRQETARIERVFNKNSNAKKEYYHRDTINGNTSYESYIKNLILAFENHYNKIDEYISNLKKASLITEKSTVKTMFIIEDVSPLGAVCYNLSGGWSERAQPIIPVLCREFLDKCKKSPNLDFILALSEYSNNKFRWIFSKNSIEDYEEKSVNYSELQFLNFTPQVVGYNVVVPKDEIEYL